MHVTGDQKSAGERFYFGGIVAGSGNIAKKWIRIG